MQMPVSHTGKHSDKTLSWHCFNRIEYTMNRLFIFLLLLLPAICFAGGQPAYKNASLSPDVRARDLLARMTTEEKFWQLFMISEDFGGDTTKYHNGIFGFQLNAAANNNDAAQQMMQYNAANSALQTVRKVNAIQRYFTEHTRLGIPVIIFNEALHGIIARGATNYPQAIALAATFDTALVHRIAGSIARQSKTLGVRQVLGPVINIATDVRWGRTEETYGEDPFLSSETGVAYVSAIEQQNIITTPKHFIANVADGGRDSYPVHTDERTLETIHYPPFLACIQRGGARSVMSSYNALNGYPCSMNDALLNRKLKQEWGFSGFVISDAGAVGGANVLHDTSPDYPTSGKQAIDNGLDVIFQTAWEHYRLFIPHFTDGTVDTARFNDAVFRVLKAKFELGLFEHPYLPEPAAPIADNNDRELARLAAQESIVLLKNDHHLLPLGKDVQKIAVIGEDAVAARPGGYSGPGNHPVNMLTGIRNAAKNIQVSYTPGCGRRWDTTTIIPDSVLYNDQGTRGLKAAYYNNINLAGQPDAVKQNAHIDFHWTISSPDEHIHPDFFSARWTGRLKAPLTGNVRIGLEGNDGFRLYINDSLVIDNWKKESYRTMLIPYRLVKDQSYELRIEFFEPNGNGAIKLLWNAGIKDSSEAQIAAAVQAAQQADVAIVTAGIEEGEFRDRALLSLPGRQEEMIQRIAATGTPVVVILSGGSAVTMSRWINQVPAILDAWYPGDEGGNAVVDVLFGRVNPSGRLPITFPLHEGQLPLVYNHEPTGRGDDYDNLSGLPLFPFGFGLSYTSFSYSGFTTDKQQFAAGDSVTVSFVLKNTGSRDGAEVVQLYIRDLLASVARPVMELKGFQRVYLRAGESKKLSFRITPGMLSMPGKDLKPVTEPGDFSIMIGASSRDIRLKQTVTVQ